MHLVCPLPSPLCLKPPQYCLAEWQHWVVEKGNPWPDARQPPQQYDDPTDAWNMSHQLRVAPNVSTATGTKQYDATKLLYFRRLRSSASQATTPGPETAKSMWIGASVSGHVKSHTRHRPFDQGDKVNPSGRLLTTRKSEGGSRRQGTSAEVRARLIRSLTELWRGSLPADLRQLKPWRSVLSTDTSHTQTCDAHTGAPSRNATAIRRDELSNRVPIAEQGRAWRKTPEWGAAAAIRRALPAWLV